MDVHTVQMSGEIIRIGRDHPLACQTRGTKLSLNAAIHALAKVRVSKEL